MKFTAQDSHKKKRIKKRWRRPRGLHSKMRLSLRGYRKTVKLGYGNPRKKRHMRKGLRNVLVFNKNDLENIDKDAGITIANVGRKKKKEIVEEAVKKKITIFNVKDPQEFLKEVEEMMKKKKQEKEKKEEEKKKVKKEKKEELAEKIKKEEEKKEGKTEEEIKEEEKKEKDKLLTKRK